MLNGNAGTCAPGAGNPFDLEQLIGQIHAELQRHNFPKVHELCAYARAEGVEVLIKLFS